MKRKITVTIVVLSVMSIGSFSVDEKLIDNELSEQTHNVSRVDNIVWVNQEPLSDIVDQFERTEIVQSIPTEVIDCPTGVCPVTQQQTTTQQTTQQTQQSTQAPIVTREYIQVERYGNSSGMSHNSHNSHSSKHMSHSSKHMSHSSKHMSHSSKHMSHHNPQVVVVRGFPIMRGMLRVASMPVRFALNRPARVMARRGRIAQRMQARQSMRQSIRATRYGGCW